MNQNEVINLKESKEVYIGCFGERKVDRHMILYYNLKNYSK